MLNAGAVILNYNTTKNIIEFSKQFKHYKNINHFVIVDNQSNDNLFTELEKIKSENIDVIQSDRNGGYAYGNNLGAKFLIDNYDVDIVYIVNPDIYFTDEDIKKVNEAFEKFPEYALIGAKNSDINGKYNKRQYWKIPYFKDELYDCFYLTRKIKSKREVYNLDNEKEEIIQVEVVPGCFWGIRKNILKEVDYLDENTFLYYEENILAYKLKNKNYKSAILLTVTVKQDRKKSSTKEINRSGKDYEYCLQSKRYYDREYLKLSKSKLYILDLCMKYSLLERKILLKMKYWR